MTPATTISVRLIKPLKGRVIRYGAALIQRDAQSLTVRALWPGPDYDFGIFDFVVGDTLIETYYADRWYNIFSIFDRDGRHKGWYCNVARPALIGDQCVDSEDLELDLLIASDRSQMRVDDEDEFEARDLERLDPEAHQAALAALAELQRLAAAGEPPFDRP